MVETSYTISNQGSSLDQSNSEETIGGNKKLTSKKIEYLKTQINDKNGKFDYL